MSCSVLFAETCTGTVAVQTEQVYIELTKLQGMVKLSVTINKVSINLESVEVILPVHDHFISPEPNTSDTNIEHTPNTCHDEVMLQSNTSDAK